MSWVCGPVKHHLSHHSRWWGCLDQSFSTHHNWCYGCMDHWKVIFHLLLGEFGYLGHGRLVEISVDCYKMCWCCELRFGSWGRIYPLHAFPCLKLLALFQKSTSTSDPIIHFILYLKVENELLHLNFSCKIGLSSPIGYARVTCGDPTYGVWHYAWWGKGQKCWARKLNRRLGVGAHSHIYNVQKACLCDATCWFIYVETHWDEKHSKHLLTSQRSFPTLRWKA